VKTFHRSVDKGNPPTTQTSFKSHDTMQSKNKTAAYISFIRPLTASA